MQLTMGNVQSLVRDCNNDFRHNGGLFHLTLDSFNSEAVELVLTTNLNIGYKVCYIKLFLGNSVGVAFDYNTIYKMNLKHTTEIEQMIVFFATEYMYCGSPQKFIITQELKDSYENRIIKSSSGKYACVRRTVIRYAVISGLAEILNARISENGSVVVDFKTYGQTDYKTVPTKNIWWN